MSGNAYQSWEDLLQSDDSGVASRPNTPCPLEIDLSQTSNDFQIKNETPTLATPQQLIESKQIGPTYMDPDVVKMEAIDIVPSSSENRLSHKDAFLGLEQERVNDGTVFDADGKLEEAPVCHSTPVMATTRWETLRSCLSTFPTLDMAETMVSPPSNMICPIGSMSSASTDSGISIPRNSPRKRRRLDPSLLEHSPTLNPALSYTRVGSDDLPSNRRPSSSLDGPTHMNSFNNQTAMSFHPNGHMAMLQPSTQNLNNQDIPYYNVCPPYQTMNHGPKLSANHHALSNEKGNHLSTRPKLTYASMIGKVLLKAPNQQLTISKMYDAIVEEWPYFGQDVEKRWRNAIRHNLSVNECFIKAGQADSGRGSFWTIHPACISAFQSGSPRRRELRKMVQQAQKAHETSAHLQYRSLQMNYAGLNHQNQMYIPANMLPYNPLADRLMHPPPVFPSNITPCWPPTFKQATYTELLQPSSAPPKPTRIPFPDGE